MVPEIENPKFTINGGIECFLSFPDGERVPCHLSASDPMTAEMFARALELDPQPYDGPTMEELLTAERSFRKASRTAVQIALHRAGRLDEAATLAASDPEAKLIWDNAPVYRRASPLVAALAAGAGWTDAEIDAVFDAAAEIERNEL